MAKLTKIVVKWILKGFSREKIFKRLKEDYGIRVTDDIKESIDKLIERKKIFDKKQKKRKNKTVTDLRSIPFGKQLKYR